MKQVAYIDGDILHGGQACVPVDDLGLQRGYAVFDYARAYDGKLFHFRDHLARFRRSADALRLNLKYTDDDVIVIAKRLIGKLGVGDAGLRFLLTGGSAHASPLLENPRFILIAEELPTYPAEMYAKGIKLVTHEFHRDLPLVKTTNYMNAFRLEPLKREKDADNILYCFENKVLECPRDNFFLVCGDVLVTARDDVLRGITRSVVINLAKSICSVEERDIQIDELDRATEAFISSTSMQVVPVVQIDDRRIGTGKIGPNTQLLMSRFDEYINEYESD
ncbi:MAG: aminotransferase class IV family protein [Candidatus Latescibacterota bacterium]|nr:MAG: aminotransferase class IV family protein [Candidatus Latescibacterota bacterium]